MKAKDSFDLTSDWNYLPQPEVTEDEELGELKMIPLKELDGLRYDDLMGLSWTLLEEFD